MTINSDIHIVVQSKYPHILENFKKSFFETTKNFSKLTLHIIDGSSYVAIEINKILRPLLSKREGYAFGVFNDDLVFSEGWLEDVCEALKSNHCVSGGYVETDDMDVFKKAVDMTKDDEGFEWSVDDLDFAWRIKLNGLSSITLKRIRTCHLFGKTREHNMKQWNYISTLNKEKFYDKHGYRSYRNIRGEYKKWHRYFQCYKT